MKGTKTVEKQLSARVRALVANGMDVWDAAYQVAYEEMMAELLWGMTEQLEERVLALEKNVSIEVKDRDKPRRDNHAAALLRVQRRAEAVEKKLDKRKRKAA